MLLESFARAATSGRGEAARRQLSAEIESDPWGRLILGLGWDGDALAPGGPLGWAPLLYATHSCFPSVSLVASLLRRGADPASSFANEYGSMSALYGAAGVVHSVEITRLLLDAGASPNDGESVYHSVEAADPGCLALLLEHGGDPSDGLGHALDFDRLEPVRMLLEAGADVSGNVLVHAVRRGRGPEFVQLLVAFGAPVDRPGGEGFRGDSPVRTPYQHAVLRGLIDVAETLAAAGADVSVSDEDRAVAALRALPAAPDYDQQEAVILAALRGRLDSVVALAGPDFGGVVGGSPPGNLIHHAAYLGDADVVARLLELGADPVAAAPIAWSTPLAWCYLGSSEWMEPGRDHVAVARALLAAGAAYEPRFADVAAGPLADASLTA